MSRSLLQLLLAVALITCSVGETTDENPDPKEVIALVVFPQQAAISLGQTFQFVAYGRTLDGDSALATVSWSTDGGEIGGDGLYTAAANPGFYRVVATHAQRTWLSDTADVTVGTVPVGAVTVTPESSMLAVGASLGLTATVTDGFGNELTGRPVTWSTSAGAVAEVDQAGVVTGVAPGDATITATCGGFTGSAAVEVQEPLVAAVVLTPTAAALRPGGTLQFQAEARDQFDNIIDGIFDWSAEGGTINSSGLYVAGSVTGTYSVVATEASGLADTATVTVREQLAGYPNEPAGMVPLGEHGFPAGYFGDDAVFGAAATYTAPGTLWHMRDLSKGLHIETDIADAPMSPPGTMGMAYPAGMPSSGEPASFSFFIPEQRELYVSYHFMMPRNPVSGMWELEPAGVKILGYISYADNDEQNQGFPLFKPGGLQAGPLQARSDYVGKPDACADYVGEPNRITLDEWHQFEFYGKLNDMGESNGVLRIWLDGELYSECDQMTYIIPDYPHGFWQIHFQPVWGGWHEGLTKTQDDYAYLDHIYVSGTAK